MFSKMISDESHEQSEDSEKDFENDSFYDPETWTKLVDT